MVDAFKSGAAIINSGTFHTPTHPHVECVLPAASAMIYTELTGYLQTPRQLPRPPAGLSPEEHAAVGRLERELERVRREFVSGSAASR